MWHNYFWQTFFHLSLNDEEHSVYAWYLTKLHLNGFPFWLFNEKIILLVLSPVLTAMVGKADLRLNGVWISASPRKDTSHPQSLLWLCRSCGAANHRSVDFSPIQPQLCVYAILLYSEMPTTNHIWKRFHQNK